MVHGHGPKGGAAVTVAPTPYRSLTPWEGFTPREKKRSPPLPVCPQAACRRAKACIRAIDGLYCQRTHLDVSEIRAKSTRASLASLPGLKRNPSPKQVEVLRIMTEHLLEEAQARSADMTARWKRGELDHLYGKYTAKGALMLPPPKLYVDARRRHAKLAQPPQCL
jgi:hypothetical protein